MRCKMLIWKKKKNKLLDSVGEGKGGMIWENSIETCTLPYVKQMTSAKWSLKQGTQSRCSGTTQSDGVEKEVGGVSEWGTHVPEADSRWNMAKTLTVL